MSKRNENRPGYKKGKSGLIPCCWDEKNIIDLSLAGITNGVFNDPEKVGSGYRLINVQDLYVEPCIDITALNRLEISEDEFKRYQVRYGDIFFTRSSIKLEGIAHCNINLSNDHDITFDGHIMKLSPDQDIVDPIYLRLYCLTERARRFFMSNAKHTTMTTIGQKETSKLPIPLPPLFEQKKIAEILSAWDRVIEQVGKLINAKQRLKKGLMQQLLTGLMRFPEFGNPVEKKGELPEGWKACKLGACFKERKETNPDLPLLAITSGRGVIPRDEVERKDTSNADKSKYKRIAPGDIGYNTMRMWQGVSAVSTLKGIVSPAYTICTPEKGHSSSFFGYLFKYSSMIHLFHRFSQGLVSDTLNLKFRHFSQVKANFPSEAEQTRIATVLSTCDREIQLLTQKRDLLQEQKKGLMQKLLTGEVRVKI